MSIFTLRAASRGRSPQHRSLAIAAQHPRFGPPWISIETPPNPFDATLARRVPRRPHVSPRRHRRVRSDRHGGRHRLGRSAQHSTRVRHDLAPRNLRAAEAVAERRDLDAGDQHRGQAQGVTALVDISSQGDVATSASRHAGRDRWDLPQQVTAATSTPPSRRAHHRRSAAQVVLTAAPQLQNAGT